jgi:archaellum component FlaC
MNDTQLFLAIGVPSFLVLIGILLNLVGSSRIETRLDGRIDRAENGIGSRLDRIENRLTPIENRLTTIEGDLRRFYQILGEHTAKIENLEKKTDRT